MNGQHQPKAPDVVSADGLRYKSKGSGTPILATGSYVGTISCLLCGKFRPRSSLRPVNLTGTRNWACKPRCDADPPV